jgi:HK97 gp10 family phage protein
MPGIIITRDTRKLDALVKAAENGQIGRLVVGDTADKAKTYIRSHWSGRYPPASLPGEPPAIRTGKLDLSVRVEQPTFSNGVTTGGVEATAPYAGYLEFGTSKMAARPFMRPALFYISRDLPQTMKAMLFRAIP